MIFENNRRQRFISELHYKETEEKLLSRVIDYRLHIENKKLSVKSISRYRWMIASYALEIIILRYTAGRPIEELRAMLPGVIEDFDVYIANEISPRLQNPPRAVADTLEITQIEAYVYVLWLLSLCKLLGHETLIAKVMHWVDKTFEFNRGRDILFENIVQALTGSHVASEKVLLHPLPFRPLGRATVYAPEERPALVKEFLDGWYKNLKDCYWHGTHTDKEGSSYFGYWAFEAALVTVLWDIDDSSYRDHLVYPKDLADWARSHLKTAAPITPQRTPGGQHCPQAGWWYTLALSNSRRYFQAGEMMPVIEGSAYGQTFWLWDADQSAPQL